MTKSASMWTRLKGKVIRPVADAAGDRQAEAKADVQAHTGREPDDAAVETTEQKVRERHGDVQPPERRP